MIRTGKSEFVQADNNLERDPVAAPGRTPESSGDRTADLSWDDLERAYDDLVDADHLSRVAWGGQTVWRMKNDTGLTDEVDLPGWLGF